MATGTPVTPRNPREVACKLGQRLLQWSAVISGMPSPHPP
jgi:hypothetical protein